MIKEIQAKTILSKTKNPENWFNRLEAIKELSRRGIYTGVLMMPILPFVLDNAENISKIVDKTYKCGGKFIIPAFGMTTRDRQRKYYYKKLDEIFPGLSSKYVKTYGSSYGCHSPEQKRLKQLFNSKCRAYGIKYKMRELDKYEDKRMGEQLTLF